MYSAQDRRGFLVASSAAALAAFVPAASLAQRRETEGEVENEVLRQFRSAVRHLHEGRPEAARQVGSLLRIISAHGRSNSVDQRARAALRRMGKVGVLNLEIDQASFSAAAKAFGIENPPQVLYVPMDARDRIYEQMVKEGVTPFLERAATYFENWPIEPMQLAAARAAARRTCGELAEVIFWTEIGAAAACLFGGPVCGGFVGAWIGFSIAYRIKCY